MIGPNMLKVNKETKVRRYLLTSYLEPKGSSFVVRDSTEKMKFLCPSYNCVFLTDFALVRARCQHTSVVSLGILPLLHIIYT